MDPSTLINEGSFPNANATSYNLAEIWPFSMNGRVGDSGGGLGLRRPQFAQNLAQFGDVSGNDPMSLDQRGNHSGGGGARKHSDVAEDESPKGVSASNGFGNGVVFRSFNSNNSHQSF